MITIGKDIKIQIDSSIFNAAYLPQLEQYDKRINVYYGGGGSGKSHFVVQKMIYKYLKYPNRKCLVVRKVGNTLRESIYALFKSILSDWQLSEKVKCVDTLFTITLPNGSQFIFKGLDDSEKIKSIANIDDIVIEEASDLTLEDYTQLNLRLRSRNPYNQIHLMFNPVSKSNWTYLMWFDENANYNKGNTFILHTTYQDNLRFLPQDYIDSLLEMKSTNYTYYLIYALGQFATLDKLVYNNWTEQYFDYREIMKNDKDVIALFGLDFGYTNDPTAFVCALVDNKNKSLYIYDEFQERGLLNDEIVKRISEMGFTKEVIIADSSEPKSIDDLRRNGLLRVKAARKGRDSIIHGIQFLQQYKIYINPCCTHILQEFQNYTWQKDKSGIYINKPIDKYNHGLDALRYAVEDISKGRNKIKLLDRRKLGL